LWRRLLRRIRLPESGLRDDAHHLLLILRVLLLDRRGDVGEVGPAADRLPAGRDLLHDCRQ